MSKTHKILAAALTVTLMAGGIAIGQRAVDLGTDVTQRVVAGEPGGVLGSAVGLAAGGFQAAPFTIPRYNGLQPNGLLMNGFKLNGFRLNGFRLNGFRLNGYRFNGVFVNGRTQSPVADLRPLATAPLAR